MPFLEDIYLGIEAVVISEVFGPSLEDVRVILVAQLPNLNGFPIRGHYASRVFTSQLRCLLVHGMDAICQLVVSR